MKIFETDAEIVALAEEKFSDTPLVTLGINLKVMSVTKAKDVLKITRANATTQFLTKNEDLITLFVYEEAFDRLSDEYKHILMEGIFSNVSYDTEKEKLNVDGSRYGELFRMRRKYPHYVDIAEAAEIVIQQIEEEEKQRKEEEKIRKAEEREAKKRQRQQN